MVYPNQTFQASLDSVTALHRAGVPILAGTDAFVGPDGTAIPGIPSVYYGSSLHDELENLVEAGMQPVEALRAAAIQPALWFGLVRLFLASTPRLEPQGNWWTDGRIEA